MKIETFDRATLKVLRNAMSRALNEAGIEGVEFAVGNMSFTATEATIKVVAKTAGAKAVQDDYLIRMAKLHGVENLAVGGIRLVEYHPKKRKYPFIYVDLAGKRWKCSPEQARDKFGSTREAA